MSAWRSRYTAPDGAWPTRFAITVPSDGSLGTAQPAPLAASPSSHASVASAGNDVGWSGGGPAPGAIECGDVGCGSVGWRVIEVHATRSHRCNLRSFSG